MNMKLITAAVITGFVANMAAAQTSTFDNAGAAEDAIDNLTDDIADDAERDLPSFGTEGREIGTYGSVALRFIASSKSDDTSSVSAGVGMRYGSFDGVNGIDVNLNFAYAEDTTADDVNTESENRLLAGLDYRRNFGAAYFAYGQADLSLNKLITDGDLYRQDIFVGAGLGYRILNDANAQWSVQAGPGYRVAEQGNGTEVTEFAASLSSNLFYALSDTAYITNDTDVIYSETATTISNDLAVSVALSDTLSLRTSYTAAFSDASGEFTQGDNTLGASIVYNFN